MLGVGLAKESGRQGYRAALYAVWLGAALMPGLGLAASGCDDLSGRPIQFGVDWQTEVKPLLQSACAGCHSFGGDPDFSDVGVDAIFKIVDRYAVPGAPLQSRLFVKINCDSPDGGFRMPFFEPALSLEDQELIYDWIAQGALGEDPPGQIARDFIMRDGLESLRAVGVPLP